MAEHFKSWYVLYSYSFLEQKYVPPIRRQSHACSLWIRWIQILSEWWFFNKLMKTKLLNNFTKQIPSVTVDQFFLCVNVLFVMLLCFFVTHRNVWSHYVMLFCILHKSSGVVLLNKGLNFVFFVGASTCGVLHYKGAPPP